MTTATSKTESTATKSTGKRRGGYSFSASPATEAKTTSTSKKGTRSAGTAKKKSSARTTSTASKAHNTASKPHSTNSRAASSSAKTGRSNLDLGFASIAKSAADTGRQNAQRLNNAASKSSNAFNGAFANVATNAKQMHEKVSNFGREVSNNLTQSASRAAENTNRTLELHRANADAVTQSYSAAQAALKEASQEIFSFFNNAFTKNVEAARQALECRNIGELFQIHNDLAKQNIESAFEQALRISEIAIETATQAIEPINESVSKNSKKFAQYSA